ncbi:MAG: pyridoxal-phosphate dependent enzyme [Planctomycetota bacterium]
MGEATGRIAGERWGEGSLPDAALAGEVTIERVRAAAARIEGLVHRTAVLTSRTIDERLGARVLMKGEHLQRVGAFKCRGAMSAMTAMDPGVRARGVLAYSSGNHAQAMACAAGELGVPAVIIMPSNAPAIKVAGVRGYLARAPRGSEVMTYDPQTVVREELGARVASERGLTIIPPYDHPEVIAGQATAALELFEEVGDLDRLYVCCGGGGLLSGCATVARALCPACEVIGVEPELGDDATRSFASGRLCVVRNPATIADGARTPFLGRYTFPIVLERVDRMRTVSDAELAAWVAFGLARLKQVFEPSGVLGLAGAAADARDAGGLGGARIGVIVSGGNVDPAALAGVLDLAGAAGAG